MTLRLMMVTAIVIAVLAPPDNWKSDAANAKITFTVKGPFGTVNGSFSGLQTEIKFDEKDPAASSMTASVDAKSVSTGVGLRNKDLRNKEEWFNTDKFPRISFHSKKIEKAGAGFKALGELTIKGVTKPAEIPFTFTSNVFKGTFVIKREDFNLGKPGGSVGNEITVKLEVPVKK
jgi:polyisoprenoid-binding protein YceI